MTSRESEVRALLALSPEEIQQRAGERLIVSENLDALHRKFAADIAREIEQQNTDKQQTRLILPVGPTGQYPYLIEILKERGISLKNCWFFFMDEYCDAEGKVLPVSRFRSAVA